MNRTHLRPVPTPSTPAGEASERELIGFFDGLLDLGERDEETPDYETLEAAVDGRLDAVEAERFESRLAADPALAAEFAGLVALRDRLGRSTAQPQRAVRTASGQRWIGLAAAAVLVLVAGLGLRFESARATSTMASLAAPVAGVAVVAPTKSSTVVFVDSFEGGTTDHWSN